MPKTRHGREKAGLFSGRKMPLLSNFLFAGREAVRFGVEKDGPGPLWDLFPRTFFLSFSSTKGKGSFFASDRTWQAVGMMRACQLYFFRGWNSQ